MSFSSLLDVSIDFDTSHLVFPTLIAAVLVILLVAIAATNWRVIVSAVGATPTWPAGIDHMRFFGTLIATVIYFIAMPAVGNLYPNTGLGFYICSIVYLFGLGALYLHKRDRRHLTIVTLNALIAPSLVWFILSEIFNLSLP
ncbi:tripartite tricarboxylate transporter TctB family protein [Thalassospira sp.]|uniref:tripartite tricarboxylate transporter TctB family protein n=1 Tax=Thalassospira sp. TaxID=1912094 RepID=UPI002732749A|nr:tripartite tricarboxylate transporter TctB family protein [Thalassospira sp.]MDP2700339.1 tripartite tricarboxylate transporter TctB family protein [Thalassospira sp.]